MIKNIIFDLGDVLINLDKEALPKALTAYGAKAADPELLALSHAYEKGAISTDRFLVSAAERLGEPQKERLAAYWNQAILDFPEGRLTFLEALSAGGAYRMFLVSNTNDLHMERVRKTMGMERYVRFQKCFEGFYLSHEIGLRKPDPGIFLRLLDSHGLLPEETLFIDDTLEHILSAAALGLQTWHLQVGREDVRELLNRI